MIDVKALAESRMGAAGILQRRAQQQGLLYGPAYQQQVKQQKKSLSQLQQQAKHKGPIPSNKPSWRIAKSIGRKALSYHSPIGLGLTAGLDALVPGLGFVARAVQQTFGDSKSHVLGTLATLTDARYPHRIPKVAKSPTNTNLDFTWGPDGMKKRRKKPMDRLINPNGQYLR